MANPTTDDLEGQLADQGFCLLEEVIPPAEVDPVGADVLRAVDLHRQERTDAPANIGAVSGLIRYCQSFTPYLIEDRLAALCQALLGEHYRVSYTSSIVNYPGNARGDWHADWPFNQRNAGHVEAPYPDMVMHLTTLWMLSPFTRENGGTLVSPGSHREPNNPSGGNGVDPQSVLEGETALTGDSGTVAVLDSRLWHAAAPNRSDQPRVGLAIRFAPWWLNLDSLMPGSDERRRLADERGMKENLVPPVPRELFERLAKEVRPLFRHWVR